jgi:hypothetical protein
MLKIKCAQCGSRYTLKDDAAGKTAKCKCGAQFKVPSPTAPLNRDLSDLFSDEDFELEEAPPRPVLPPSPALHPSKKRTKKFGETDVARKLLTVVGFVFGAVVSRILTWYGGMAFVSAVLLIVLFAAPITWLIQKSLPRLGEPYRRFTYAVCFLVSWTILDLIIVIFVWPLLGVSIDRATIVGSLVYVAIVLSPACWFVTRPGTKSLMVFLLLNVLLSILSILVSSFDDTLLPAAESGRRAGISIGWLRVLSCAGIGIAWWRRKP